MNNDLHIPVAVNTKSRVHLHLQLCHHKLRLIEILGVDAILVQYSLSRPTKGRNPDDLTSSKGSYLHSKGMVY
jgi:hypothetical protein